MSSNDELAEFKAQLARADEVLSVDPDNVEQKQLRDSLLELIALLEADTAEVTPTASPAAAAAAPPPPPPSEKLPKKGDAPVTIYNTNEKVLARWTDGKFYSAVIKSSFGPNHAKQYIVRYSEYNDQRTVGAKELKPLNPKPAHTESEPGLTNKRKIDSVSHQVPNVVSSSQAAASSGTVSAGPKIDADLAQQFRADSSKAADDTARPAKISKKLASKGALNRSKASWRDFQASGKVKQKESMFRTSDSAQYRVGITGSGQPMTSDPKRMRHVHKKDD